MGSFVVYHYVKNCDKAHLFIGKRGFEAKFLSVYRYSLRVGA